MARAAGRRARFYNRRGEAVSAIAAVSLRRTTLTEESVDTAVREIEIEGTSYVYAESQQPTLTRIAERVARLRETGALTPDVLHRLRKYFRIKNVYHSNAIEGNTLSVGETRQVVELGMTLTGKSLKDQAEARSLGAATDFLESLVKGAAIPITEADLRQIHSLVLKGVDDENAGRYRRVPVTISGSAYSPPGPESVPAEMNEFGSWLAQATAAHRNAAPATGLLTAATAHTWFVHVHPFVDGNGRVARLLMNLVLMRSGIPIAIIARDDRMRYYDALEQAQTSDLSGVVALLCECVHESLEEYEKAADEQREQEEWAKSIAERFEAQAGKREAAEYEVWRSAMDLLMGHMRQTALMISESTRFARIWFKEFGHLTLDKYVALKHRQSAKRTWFFRIDFRSGDRSARYLFFFGFPSEVMKPSCDVTLWISREEPPGSYNYDRLEDIHAANVPTACEIGYVAKEERFILRNRAQRTQEGRIETIGKAFFDDVIRKHFGT